MLISVFSANLFAQKSVSICGEYTYYAPENISIEKAKQIALERAIINALGEKFGTLVSQTNTTLIQKENESDNTIFFSLGGSNVKGEWLETTKDPSYNIYYKQGMLVVSVSVCGKAREIKNSTIDLSCKILRNGITEQFENDQFKNGDSFYVSFQSPINGYLTIYLLNASQNVYCLLPYMRDANGQTSIIKGNQNYILFLDSKSDEQNFVDEYTLTTEKEME